MKTLLIWASMGLNMAFGQLTPPSTDKLNHEEFKVRKEAYVQLNKWALGHNKPDEVKKHLLDLYKTKDPEIRSRSLEVLKQFVAQQTQEGYLGVSFHPVFNWNLDDVHTKISDIIDLSPAALAGLQKDDIVVGIGEQEFDPNNIDSVFEISLAIKKIKPYSVVKIKFKRDEELVVRHVVMGFRTTLDLHQEGNEKFFDEWLKNELE